MTSKHLNISEQTRLKYGRSNDEHEYLYRFLLISPSYQLAHRYVNGGVVSPEEIANVQDWKLVLTTYSRCGDIFNLAFLKWWDQTGRDLLYELQSDGTYTADGPLAMSVNKINELTLHEALKLIYAKHTLEIELGKKAENWSLGVKVMIKSQWVSQLKVGDKRSPQNLEARTKLGILVSRKFKEALYLAENAARGDFPSLNPIDSGLKFDYVTAYAALKNYYELRAIDHKERRKLGLHIPRPKRYRVSANYYREKSKIKKAVNLELKKLKMMR
jgi:hypothetical protein